MAKALHAIDYLDAPQEHAPQPVNVVFGDEAFLKRQVLSNLKKQALGTGDADFSLTVFEGKQAELADVLDELSTMAMFGGSTRLVLVEEADDFVTRYRPELENYVDSPRPTGRLILETKSWPATTRIYKAVAAKGLPIDCSAPKAGEIPKWLIGWARKTHGVQLAMAAAGMLVDFVGTELGLLDQEVSRLALSVGEDRKISAQTVSQNVGSWRARTTWDMLDAALAGDLKGALTQLDRLLLAGEHPVAVLAQIAATLRRFAAATRIVLAGEGARSRVNVRDALEQAGVRSFVLKKAEVQLRHLGRERGSQLYRWLVETDLALKGNSAVPPRLVIENLLIRLSAPTRLAGSHAIR
jgi:DNA polymerase-3 subunit delta